MKTATLPGRTAYAMLTDAATQTHELVDLPVTAILFDRRTGNIHKMGTPAAIAAWSPRFLESLRSVGVLSRMAEDATIVVGAFTREERERFGGTPRSILRDERVRSLPTCPVWHECRVERIDGVVPVAEAHLGWTAVLDGATFGRFETHLDAEEALIAETTAIAPLKPRLF